MKKAAPLFIFLSLLLTVSCSDSMIEKEDTNDLKQVVKELFILT